MTRRLLIFAGGLDSGGVGYAMKAAMDSYADGWECRAVRRNTTYLDYPSDITWPRTDLGRYRSKVQRLFDVADIVQVQQVPKVLKSLRGWDRKPFVVLELGTYFRNDPVGVTRDTERMGGRVVVNSLELLSLAPRADLLLWPIDVDLMARMREEHRRPPDDRIVIYHSPTDRAIKSTAAFIAATERLKARYPQIDVVITERVSWMENLRRKANADIVFDQVHLGYGLNAAEAWAMGIPVVAGLAAPRARQLFMDRYGGFPYLDATEDTLETRLEDLIASAAERERWGHIGYQFVHAEHAPSVIAPQAVALYERHIAEQARAA